jgi:hypothetical protein
LHSNDPILGEQNALSSSPLVSVPLISQFVGFLLGIGNGRSRLFPAAQCLNSVAAKVFLLDHLILYGDGRFRRISTHINLLLADLIKGSNRLLYELTTANCSINRIVNIRN